MARGRSMDTGCFTSIASELTAHARCHTSKIIRKFPRGRNCSLTHGKGLENEGGSVTCFNLAHRARTSGNPVTISAALVVPASLHFPVGCPLHHVPAELCHCTMLLGPFPYKRHRCLLCCARWGYEWFPGSYDLLFLVGLPPNLQLEKSIQVMEKKLVCVYGRLT